MRTTNTKATLMMAVTLLLSACGGAGLDEPNTPRSPPPADLAGSWFTGNLSSIQYYDRNTGAFQNPSGSGFYYVFHSDGSYETGAVIDSTVGGCNMRLLGAEAGTITSDNQTLNVHRHYVTTHVTNSCGNSGDRTQGQAERSMAYWVTRDEDGLEWLTLVHEDQTVEKYRRWK